MRKTTSLNLLILLALPVVTLAQANSKVETPEPNKRIAQSTVADNTLSPQEVAEGWRLLFDGVTMSQWVSPSSGTFPTQGFDVENGELIVNQTPGKGGGDIRSKEQYKNFEFSFDYYLTKGANNGIKYLYQTEVSEANSSHKGPEFQLLDDDNHPDAKLGFMPNCRKNGSLYDILPTISLNNIFKGIETWNCGKVVVNNNTVQHWLNGVKVLEYDRSSYMFEVLRAQSKFKECERFGQFEQGYLLITDHHDTVKFKNLKIKPLD